MSPIQNARARYLVPCPIDSGKRGAWPSQWHGARANRSPHPPGVRSAYLNRPRPSELLILVVGVQSQHQPLHHHGHSRTHPGRLPLRLGAT